MTAGFELTNTAAGFLTSLSGGVHAGYEYTYSWTESTFIEGEVGDLLPSSYEPERSFDWGIFVYEHRDGAQSFPVVTYWVDGGVE